MIAAKALADVKRYGRIDEETTCNIGIIGGGKATNIVPDLVTIEGDARSRNKEKLEAICKEIVETIATSAEKYGAKAEVLWITSMIHLLLRRTAMLWHWRRLPAQCTALLRILLLPAAAVMPTS